MGIENYSVSGNHHELNRTSFDGNTFKGTEWNNTSHVTNDKNNGVEFVFGEGMNLKLNSRYNNGGDDVFPNLDKKHTGISFDLLDKFIAAADKGVLEDVDHKGYTAEDKANFGQAFDKLRKEKLAAAQYNPYSKEYTKMKNGTEFSFSASEIEMLYKAAGFDVKKQAEEVVVPPAKEEATVPPAKKEVTVSAAEEEKGGEYQVGTESQMKSVDQEAVLNQIVEALGIQDANNIHIDFGGMEIDDNGTLTKEVVFSYNGEQYVIQQGNVEDLKVVKQEVPNPETNEDGKKYETRYNAKTGKFQKRQKGSFLGIHTHKWKDVDEAEVPAAERKRLQPTPAPAANNATTAQTTTQNQEEDLLAAAYAKVDAGEEVTVAAAMYKKDGENVVTESGKFVERNGKKVVEVRIGNQVKYYEPIVVTTVGTTRPTIVTGAEIKE